MEYRLAVFSDLEAIKPIIDDARSFLKQAGVNQWQNGYPNESVILEDIRQHHAYVVLIDQQIVGYFALFAGIENNYRRIIGQWHSDRPYLTVHRNMLKADIRHKGQGKTMFRLVEEVAREMKYDNIRIDTHADNQVMNHLLEKMGYRYAGIIYLADGAKRLAYDKILL